MKKYIYSLVLVVIVGCSTNQAYNTLATIGATENAAMKAAAIAKVQGKLTDAQWAQIDSKHALFLKGYNTAVDAAAVTIDKATVSTEVTALETDVINLISSFGIKF